MAKTLRRWFSLDVEEVWRKPPPATKTLERDMIQVEKREAQAEVLTEAFCQPSEFLRKNFTPTAGKKGFATASPLLRTIQPRL